METLTSHPLNGGHLVNGDEVGVAGIPRPGQRLLAILEALGGARAVDAHIGGPASGGRVAGQLMLGRLLGVGRRREDACLHHRAEDAVGAAVQIVWVQGAGLRMQVDNVVLVEAGRADIYRDLGRRRTACTMWLFHTMGDIEAHLISVTDKSDD